ncbi:MAG: hypothetical protein KBD52_01550 [Candidatus Pacebacteria bacterium]|nr:hypothetical protein [Candidatus Paceibacterota bacterium]
MQVGLTYDKDDDGAIGVWGAVSILVFIFLWWFTTFSILGTWVDSMDISRLGNLATAVFLSTGIGMFVLGRYIRKSRFYSDFIWGDMMF